MPPPVRSLHKQVHSLVHIIDHLVFEEGVDGDAAESHVLEFCRDVLIFFQIKHHLIIFIVADCIINNTDVILLEI